MQFAMDKKYRTRAGDEVEILKVDAKKARPVLGIIKHPDGVEYVESWPSDGKYHEDKVKSDYDLIEVRPYEDFKKDEPVLVRQDENHLWGKRHFSHVGSNGLAYCFVFGRTSWTNSSGITTAWNFFRRPTPEELGGS